MCFVWLNFPHHVHWVCVSHLVRIIATRYLRLLRLNYILILIVDLVWSTKGTIGVQNPYTNLRYIQVHNLESSVGRYD